MGLRSPVQCSPADAAAQSFLRSAGQFRDAAGKARRRAGGAEVTRRLHRIGGRLVSRPCELRPSLIFKTQAKGALFGKSWRTDTWPFFTSWRLPRATSNSSVIGLGKVCRLHVQVTAATATPGGAKGYFRVADHRAAIPLATEAKPSRASPLMLYTQQFWAQNRSHLSSVSVTLTRCQVCGAQNTDKLDLCQQCGADLTASASATLSSSGELSADKRARAIASSQHPQTYGFAPGSLIANRYRVVSLLGRGGMGEVYAADDLKLGQRVALKFLPMKRGKSSSWRDRFYAEVRMARQVSHPNVCRVYDVGESKGQLFLSMEFVDGEDLASLLRRIGRLPDDKAVEIAKQLCAGLAAAHHSGVLHRDIKPSNVMIDGKGHARITDFGLAIVALDASEEAEPGGTPGYVAPELLDGAAPSVQSDLYAAGLVLYELFTGKRAFDARSLEELHRKQKEANPIPPSNVVKGLNPAVERAILRCLNPDPSQRPRSALSVAALLPGGDLLSAALAAGETPSPEIVAVAGPEGSLRPAVAWASLAVAVALIFGTSAFLAPHATDWGVASMNK